MIFLRAFFAISLFGIAVFTLRAQDKPDQADPFSGNVEEELKKLSEILGEETKEQDEALQYLEPGQVRELTNKVRESIVTIRQIGRDGEPRGTGTGFVVAKDLIATNLHVIGEGRPIKVSLFDGSSLNVTEITASDLHYDLALIRVATKGKTLKVLKVGNSKDVEQGQLIVGFGAPRGLEFSVVPGVVSAIRKLEPTFLGSAQDTPDYPMIQIAMPIEQGNSGGPIVNLEGEAIGVVTLKHQKTRNLGFAVQSSDLQQLINKPNPIPMTRWRTIGTLDPKQWEVVMDASWTQRGGVITAEQAGSGFGGRSLCLSKSKVPDLPYEISALVRLDDEGGAAGISFASDGQDRHYGFYPSGGNMRLTRFGGPDVYSWDILNQFETKAYLPGDWNRLRVRVEEKKIIGFVNGEKVLEIEDDILRGGQVGLCKFRQTTAEFKEFRIGKNLEVKQTSPELEEKFSKVIDDYLGGGKSEELLKGLRSDQSVGQDLLSQKADELVAKAEELRSLKNALHLQTVSANMSKSLEKEENKIDLFEVGLQIARIDNPGLDEEHYRHRFSVLVGEAKKFISADKEKQSKKDRVDSLRDFMFKESGFHGSRGEYYHHANSYLNHVLDDREGIPITLSVLFIEMARRLDLEGVYGASVPGHFMIGYRENEDDVMPTAFYDAFDSGRKVGSGEIMKGVMGSENVPSYFGPAPAKEIAVRMLRNLIRIEIEEKENPAGAENYLELLLSVKPDSAQERFQRSLIRLQEEELEGAKKDLDWLLEHQPPGIDYRKLRQFRDSLESE